MYALKLHKTLTSEKWSKYSRDQQVLMIANEMNRLISGTKNGLEQAALIECMERLFELTDLTIDSQKGNLRKELLRWREIFAENYLLNVNELAESNLEQLYKVLLLTIGHSGEQQFLTTKLF